MKFIYIYIFVVAYKMLRSEKLEDKIYKIDISLSIKPFSFSY